MVHFLRKHLFFFAREQLIVEKLSHIQFKTFYKLFIEIKKVGILYKDQPVLSRNAQFIIKILNSQTKPLKFLILND